MENLKKLSDYAKEHGMTYKEAWAANEAGILPVKTKKSKTNRIYVIEESQASVKKEVTFGTPMFAERGEMRASTRFNKAGLTTPAYQYTQIEQGIIPYQLDGGNTNSSGSNVNVSDAIKLVQKCYFNFPIFGNTIDAMTEFSTNKIFFRGGNAKSRKFFNQWVESVGLLDFQDKFFREYYLSSNVVIQKFESVLDYIGVSNINKVFGANAAENARVACKYIILNPCDIGVLGTFNFGSNPVYYKRLNGYEITRLKSNNKSKEEEAFFNSLPTETKKEIMNNSGSVNIPLDKENTYVIFYRKQDYYAMAVPMGFAVLKDIEWKAEMKQIDMAISRTMQNAILLVKMGYESKSNEYVFDQKAADSMRALFESESVGKTLVADFTTEVEFKIPQIGDFLDPKKYQIVNEDIKTGLNYVLTGTDQKFSNQYIQVQLFIQRLNRAREAFLNNFLIPEIKKIGQAMGFKSIPTPFFEDIDLKDDAEFNRIVAQLVQYGILTAEEALTAVETGRLPTGEESLESQEKFKEAKDKGFYEPITGGPSTQKQILDKTNKQQVKMMEMQQEHDSKMKTKELKHKAENPEQPAPQIVLNAPTKMAKPNGRPSGSTRKKSTNKPRVSKAEELYSLSKIKDNLILATKVNEKVSELFKAKHNKTELNDEQKQIIEEISNVIISNNEPENWLSSVEKYVENPINDNQDRLNKIDKISYNHQIDTFLASILASSEKEIIEEDEQE